MKAKRTNKKSVPKEEPSEFEKFSAALKKVLNAPKHVVAAAKRKPKSAK